MKLILRCVALALTVFTLHAYGQVTNQVVDIPTRPGVTERVLVVAPPQPVAAVILFAGGEGALGIQPDGSLDADENFLVRSRELFAGQGLYVVVVDAPSDHLSPPYMRGFRETAEHVTDIRAVIAWVRLQTHLPVWLIGTSRGTQSAAWVGIHLAGDAGPDGLVLTSTILRDKLDQSVPEMALDSLHIPVLVVHHEQDGCKLCPFGAVQGLMDKLVNVPRKQLIAETGGADEGNPCQALAHHGYNGQEADVVRQIADWIRAK